MRKQLLTILSFTVLTGTTFVACNKNENLSNSENAQIPTASTLISGAGIETGSLELYYAGIFMRKIRGCNNSIGWCPSTKLQVATNDEYISMSVTDDNFKVKIIPISSEKVTLNVIVSEGYEVEDIFEIGEDVSLDLPSYTTLESVILKAGAYSINPIGENEYNVEIDAIIE